MKTTLTVAALQMTSVNDVDINLATIEKMLGEGEASFELLILPEMFSFFGGQLDALSDTDLAKVKTAIVRWARAYNVWIVAGSIPHYAEGDSRPYSRCWIVDSHGSDVDYYDKIHLFDADVADQSKQYRESDSYRAGDRCVVVPTPWGRLGVMICYDLRFPELTRLMFQQQVDIIAIPSAFTAVTGQAHWQPLLQARAIENSCFIVAANQTGCHDDKRETWGHSMVINPWGEIVADGVENSGLIVQTLDLTAIKNCRQRMPTGQHQRIFVSDKITK
ncbi:Deaminated glutathione amidase [Sinobacterium norvegicum]|uniref:Deaminated glutathione amidase n=1 Tax=Sinobacterium norvegicum TaxID=1641715 RepID=A0ABN8EFD6_9GAMM|nr:carbon-nitrogen hydrolase family protein [Sinobacterium norvegicum]CAH0991063.1 Deaminated glutathione amidase [Sinobacterium norvegicum]